MRERHATVDFETRSACSIKNCGTWRYSVDPSTEILCLAFRLPYWEEGRTGLWHPAFPPLGISESTDADDISELLDWILEGRLLEAHIAWFERCIWQNVLVPQHGFPPIPPTSWRCSAAKAASHALPRGLDEALTALKLTVRKDAEGEKVMKKCMKPRKPRKAERLAWEKAHGNTNYPRLYWESPDLFTTLWAYCRQDVLAEDALSAALPDLSPSETQVYLLDQTINERGFRLDKGAVDTALVMIADEQARGLVELRELTGGTVQKATQRAQMLDWLSSEGVDLPNTQRETLVGMLESTQLHNHTRRAIELMLTIGRSSTAKYMAMRHQMSPEDHRVRGGLLYHGASTGRWSGSGVQPHNFPRGKIKADEMDDTWELLKYEDRDAWEIQGTTVLDTLASALRGTIIPSDGHQFYVADYAGIEARVLLWLANDQKHLDIFREDRDIYLEMASSIYGRPCTKEDKDERGLGKVAILGLGYQMGWSKFVDTALRMGKLTISDELAQQTVEAYRKKFYRVKNEWYAQEQAAVEAVQSRFDVECGRTLWFTEGDFLYCQLPSDRRLAYPFPEVREKLMPWGDYKDTLTFKGINPYSHQWERQTTYGGMLVENIVQAISRDIMAEALERCEHSEYLPVLSVHDEILAEAPLGVGTVGAFESLVAEPPVWALDCPIKAEGWCGVRYRK